jgi:GTP cyclohydrolase FolE2
MYIRQTTTQRKSDGTTYQSYRLVESAHIGDRVSQHTLLNLGSHYPVPREQWGALMDRIDEILHHHQQGLFPVEKEIEAEAQRIAKKLIERAYYSIWIAPSPCMT